MKTKGIMHTCAKNSILLSLVAFIASVPALAQVNYASLKNNSFTGQEKKLAASFQDYYAVTEAAASQPYYAPVVFFTSSPAKDITTGEEIVNSNDRGIKNNLPLTENKNEGNTKNMEISFTPTSFTYPENSRADVGIAEFPAEQLNLYAKALKEYAKKNGYDTSYAFFSNMGMLCNRKRFFVMNLGTMEIEQSGLVSHGRGQGPSVFDKQYSNQSGSRCTSLGRYKILSKYKGGYGEAYKLVGLDSSNQNALSRNIVLHSMGCIPDKDGIMPACVSDGCPAVSISFLSSLGKILDARKKPVLLWIFDSNLQEVVMKERPVKSEPTPGDSAVNEHHTCSIHSHYNLVID